MSSGYPSNSGIQDQANNPDNQKQPGENSKNSETTGTATGPSQPTRKQSRSSGSGHSGHRGSSGGHAGLRGQQAFVINPKKRALEHKQQTGSGFESNLAPTGIPDPAALAYQITSELNERLDKDIDSLLSSFSDIIKCSKVQDKDKYRIQQEKYQIECRAANLVRSCESILTLIAEMKQSLLLNDTTMFRPQPLTHSDPGSFVIPNSDPKNSSSTVATEVPQDEQEPDSLPQEDEFLQTLTNLHPPGRNKLTSLATLYPNNKLS